MHVSSEEGKLTCNMRRFFSWNYSIDGEVVKVSSIHIKLTLKVGYMKVGDKEEVIRFYATYPS